MSLEQKFLRQSDLEHQPQLRLWIGGALLAWVLVLAAIMNMVAQPNSQIADNIDSLNEIAPAAGPVEQASK